MKKLIVVLMAMIITLSVTGCNYYNKEEINGILEIKEDRINSELEALKPTQFERYFQSVVQEGMFSGDFHFAAVGDRVVGMVESWDYGYIVIELETATMVEIETISVSPA